MNKTFKTGDLVQIIDSSGGYYKKHGTVLENVDTSGIKVLIDNSEEFFYYEEVFLVKEPTWDE